MANKSMGEIVSTLRKEKGMIQKQLADILNITDKAVSKWERDIARPDTQIIPKLAEILGVSVEELMNAKSAPTTGHKGAGYLIDNILKATNERGVAGMRRNGINQFWHGMINIISCHFYFRKCSLVNLTYISLFML